MENEANLQTILLITNNDISLFEKPTIAKHKMVKFSFLWTDWYGRRGGDDGGGRLLNHRCYCNDSF